MRNNDDMHKTYTTMVQPLTKYIPLYSILREGIGNTFMWAMRIRVRTGTITYNLCVGCHLLLLIKNEHRERSANGNMMRYTF